MLISHADGGRQGMRSIREGRADKPCNVAGNVEVT
jgi:hypothetical protein